MGLWIATGVLTVVILRTGLTGFSGVERTQRITVTGIGTIAGPMTGAISRGLQACCLAFSLYRLPFALVGPIAAVATPCLVPARSTWLKVGRLSVWTVGWIVWFGSGFLSLGRALC